MVGNTVYVGGKFTTARPAGAAAGVSTTARANLLAYDITTGNLISSWAPTTDGDVLSIAAAPDGSRIYVGGSFTRVNGTVRNRIAALNPTTGALIGSFPRTGRHGARGRRHLQHRLLRRRVLLGRRRDPQQARSRARLRWRAASWAPNAQGGQVRAMVLSPDGNQLLVGGHFTTLNGSANPGYGLGSVSPTTGDLAPLGRQRDHPQRRRQRRDHVPDRRRRLVYAAGYHFGSGGNLEGIARMTWTARRSGWRTATGTPTAPSPPATRVRRRPRPLLRQRARWDSPDSPVDVPRGLAFSKPATGCCAPRPQLLQLGRHEVPFDPAVAPQLDAGTFTVRPKQRGAFPATTTTWSRVGSSPRPRG